MNEMVLLWMDLEQAMKRAITSGLLIAAIVFIAGVLFGWTYSLLLAFLILFLVNMASRRGL